MSPTVVKPARKDSQALRAAVREQDLVGMLAVFPGRGSVSRQGQVGVGVDQPWQECAALKMLLDE